MRKITAGLTIALGTFILGILVTFIWHGLSDFNSQNIEELSRIPLPPCKANATLDPDIDKSDSADLTLLTYYELADNPSCYDGKIVRVKAKLLWDDHGFYLFDAAHRRGPASIRFDDINSKEFDKNLRIACGGICSPREPLDIVAVGVFRTAEATRQTELLCDARPFRFKIKRVFRLSNPY